MCHLERQWKGYIGRHDTGRRMLSKAWQKRRQIAWDLDELELETKTGREMSMMSMIPTHHVQCFSRLAALHTLY